jgi:hypothetical protein
MRRMLTSLFALLLLGACAASETLRGPESALSPESPSTTTRELPRLWVSAENGRHSVEGFIEQSGTGMSIRYELNIVGPAERMIVGYPGDDGLIAQSAGLRAEELRTGYFSMGDPDPNMPMWRRPLGVKLTVFFKDGSMLSGKLTREP